MRLLKPMGMVKTDGIHRRPEPARAGVVAIQFAAEILAQPPFAPHPRYMVLNFSSTVALKFREEDFIALARRILEFDRSHHRPGRRASRSAAKARTKWPMCMASKRVIALDTPGPMDLAALMEKALVIFTPEGGAAHLAAAMKTPALVLWSEGPFKKWHSRGRNHALRPRRAGRKIHPAGARVDGASAVA